MNLHTDTIRVLSDRLYELEDHCSAVCADDAAEWEPTIAALRESKTAGTVEALAAHHDAAEELDAVIEGDDFWTNGRPTAKRNRIVADLCRCGYYTRHDADAVSTHRPKTMLVDGVRHDVG